MIGTSSVYLQNIGSSGGALNKLVTQVSAHCQMAWSSDGEYVALMSERELHIGSISKEGKVDLNRQVISTFFLYELTSNGT